MRQLLFAIVAFMPAVAQAQLPEWSGKLYLTVVTSGENTEADRAVLQFINTNAVAKQLRSQMIYNEFNNSTRLIKETDWAKHLGTERPIVMIQGVHTADGTADVIFFSRGKKTYDADFASCMARSIKVYGEHLKGNLAGQRRPWRVPICPGPDCPPQPQPEPYHPEPPAPVVIPEVEIPEVDVPVEEGEGGLPLLLMVLAGAGAAALGAKKNMN